MSKLIEQPEQFKAELKEKWLNYYQTNQAWLKPFLLERYAGWCKKVDYNHEELENEQYQPCRPNSMFMLGVVSILESEIQGLCNFAPPNQPDEMIKHLGLDFDPELELKKRSQDRASCELQQKDNREIEVDRQYLDRIRNGD